MPSQQNIEQNKLPEKPNQFIIFKTEDAQISVDVRFESETAWLTQAHLAELFQTSRPNITMHIKNILASGELEENVVSKNFLHTTEHGAIEGKTQTKEVKYYNPLARFCEPCVTTKRNNLLCSYNFPIPQFF
ncbi:hypothetical protein FACS189434_00310 [Bacteroidia bacterium]|nr:hypothetical protein FACS189434_00310 [Bacteroidia bacterium]